MKESKKKRGVDKRKCLKSTEKTSKSSCELNSGKTKLNALFNTLKGNPKCNNLNNKKENVPIVHKEYKSKVDDSGYSVISSSGSRRRTEDNLPIYTMEELNIVAMFFRRYIGSLSKPNFRLLIKGLPFDATKSEISDLFAEFQLHLDSIVILLQGNRPSGCAYVYFEDELQARNACTKLDGTCKYCEVISQRQIKQGRGAASIQLEYLDLGCNKPYTLSFASGTRVEKIEFEKHTGLVQYIDENTKNLIITDHNFEDRMIPLSLIGSGVDDLEAGDEINLFMHQDQVIKVTMSHNRKSKYVVFDRCML
ncbi:bifunctional RNA recognition motif domain/Protein of unknown function DUF1764 [Babesia duncani]|uniref:RRM domain-containing protein n=1 Tax=Babesia duncani TaxID=323732 RepID=A0AAD9UN40_9APIC|nr:bifunctional RNA recognition motif domain/Protein of unknown function DUF1764 [Babesia duncani]